MSLDPKIAYNFAQRGMTPGRIPVIIINCVQNYEFFQGIILDKNYSWNPIEREILFDHEIKYYVVGWRETELVVCGGTTTNGQGSHQDKLRLLYVVSAFSE